MPISFLFLLSCHSVILKISIFHSDPHFFQQFLPFLPSSPLSPNFPFQFSSLSSCSFFPSICFLLLTFVLSPPLSTFPLQLSLLTSSASSFPFLSFTLSFFPLSLSFLFYPFSIVFSPSFFSSFFLFSSYFLFTLFKTCSIHRFFSHHLHLLSYFLSFHLFSFFISSVKYFPSPPLPLFTTLFFPTLLPP